MISNTNFERKGVSMNFYKEISFHNIYTKYEDSLTLTWEFPDGFENISSAKDAVVALDQDPDLFLYIKHHNMVYAVAANMIEQSIVIASKYVWFHEISSRLIRKIFRETNAHIPYKITVCQHSDYFTKTLCQDMFQFDSKMSITLGKKIKEISSSYKDYCVSILGATMLTTMIPVYQLSAMDMYFTNTNSFLSLWELGIKKYSPFNGHHEIAPYTLQSYITEQCTEEEEVEQLTSIRNMLLNFGAMQDNPTTDTIKIPMYHARKLVTTLNALLTERGDLHSFMNRNHSLLEKLKNPEVENTQNNEEKIFNFCRICHITLPENIEDNICPMCQEQELFVAVKDFIREYDVNENDVSQHFDIPIARVRNWIKEGRITYKEMRGIRGQEKAHAVKVCRECGMQLPSSSKDNICKTCKDIQEASRKKRQKAHTASIHIDTLIDTTHMHYKKNHEK